MVREGPQDLMNIIAALGDKASGLNEQFHYHEHYARTDDEYGMSFWSEFYNRPVIIKGKETTIAQEFPNRVAPVYKAAIERYEESETQHKKYLNQKIDEALTAIQNTEEKHGYPQHPSIYKKVVDNLLNGENVTMADLERSAKGKSLIDGMNRPLEDYDKSKLDAWVKGIQEEKGRFTIAELMTPTLSHEQKVRLFPKTLEGRGLPADFDAMITNGLSKQLKRLADTQTTSEIYNPQIDFMLPRAKQHFYGYLFNYFDKNDAENIDDKEGLALLALTEYTADMSIEKDSFYATDGLGKNFKFKHFDKLAEDYALIQGVNDIVNNPALLTEKDTLTDAQDLLISNYGKRGGEMPFILEKLNEQLPHLDPIAIVNMRLKANGEKEIERKGLENLVNAVNPEYRRLITHMPSLSKTFRGLNLTLEKSGDMAEGNASVYEILIAKDIGSLFDKPYEVVRTPNGLKEAVEMGIKLESTTVAQAMNLLNSGMAASIGAFDLNRASIQRAKAKGLISDEDTLTAGMQLNIFRNDKELDTSGFIIDGMDERVPGIGQYYTLPFNYDKTRRKRSKGISTKERNERFDKNVTNLVKGVEKIMLDNLKKEGEQLQFIKEQGGFLIDKISSSIQQTKDDVQRKVDSGELKGTSRGLRPTETRKVVEDTKETIFSAEFAKKGFIYYGFTDDIKQYLGDINGYE